MKTRGPLCRPLSTVSVAAEASEVPPTPAVVPVDLMPRCVGGDSDH